ncbi:MAG: type II toxin-antitoxin system VapC family toxin [Fimbriiglobus sp.]
MRAYLDSNSIIYLIQGHPTFGPRVDGWLAHNPSELVSSELTRAETLVLPYRTADAGLVSAFDRFFAARVADMVPIDRMVWDHAARIRAAHTKLKLPDALHLAAAVAGKCDVLVTNDPDFLVFPGIRVEVL